MAWTTRFRGDGRSRPVVFDLIKGDFAAILLVFAETAVVAFKWRDIRGFDVPVEHAFG